MNNRRLKTWVLLSAITRNQTRKDAELLVEEKFYEYVGKEIDSGEIRSGLWTKATSMASSSDNEDIKREYIRLRVEHLRAEGRLYQQFLEEASETVQNREPEPLPEPKLKPNHQQKLNPQPKPLQQDGSPAEQQDLDVNWEYLGFIILCLIAVAVILFVTIGLPT